MFKVGDRVVHNFPEWHGKVTEVIKNYRFCGRNYNVYTVLWDGGVENELIKERDISLEKPEKNTISYFERLTVTEDREYIIRTPLASACVRIFHLDKRGYSRTKLTYIKPICGDLIMIPSDIAVGSIIEIEYECLDIEEDKQMTKSDLKTGMMVKLKNGEKYIALMNSIEGSVLVNKDGWLALSNYNSDLTHTDHISYDIESAYTPRAVPYILNMSEQLFSQHWEQHWERCFVKDVTMRDIEKKFGCKVKIVNEI